MKLGMWIFMLICNLLIPAAAVCYGRRFRASPPREPNAWFGYRTARSMRNRETWAFAQRYSGRFWVRAGRPVLAVSLVWMLLLFDRDIGTVGTSAVVLMGIQMLPFLAVIPATERVLRRKFG